ncbi:MAG: Ig-like domain-containing protein [Bacteroidales bacterium]
MNKIFLFVLTLALTCALSPFPLKAQSGSQTVTGTLVNNWKVGSADADDVATLTIVGTVHTNGHSITVNTGGTLTIADGATLIIDEGTANKVTLNDGTAINHGTVKAASVSGTGDHGITISGTANVTNYGLIDFGQGGKISVSNGGSNATIRSPGLIIFKQEGTLTGADNAENTPTLTGFTYTLYSSGTTKKNQLDVHGGTGTSNRWPDNLLTGILPSNYEKPTTIVVKDGADLTVPNDTTLTVAADVTLRVQPTGFLTVAGKLSVEKNGIVIVEGNASSNQNAYLAVLVGGSETTNKGTITIEGKTRVEANAVIKNDNVTHLYGSSVFRNESESVTSPGIIIAHMSENDNPIDIFTGAKDLASGFIKIDVGQTGSWMNVYGTGNIWGKLQQDYLDGSSDNPPTYGSAARLNVLPDATLTIANTTEGKLTLKNETDLPHAIHGTLIVNGEVEVSGSGVAAEIGNNDETLGGTVNVSSSGKITITASASVTAEQKAVIKNEGTILINGTSSGGELINNTPNVTSTGIIEVSGSGSLTSSKGVWPKQAVVVHKTATQLSSPAVTAIDVLGQNEWSEALLQGYLIDKDVDNFILYLNRGSQDTLVIPAEATLTVPEGKTLTIIGHRTEGSPPEQPSLIRGDGIFDSRGVTILATFPIDSIKAKRKGFILTGTTLTVYGIGNQWGGQHNNVLAATDEDETHADEVKILEGSQMNFSVLTIPSEKTVQNDGEITGGDLYVAGVLRKGAKSVSAYTLKSPFTGRINAELRREWVSFPTTGSTSSTANANGRYTLYVVSQDIHTATDKSVGGSTDTLTATQYEVLNPYVGDAEKHTRRINGIEASAAGTYGYYGYVDTAYYAVTGVAIDSEKDTIEIALGAPLKLAALVEPAEPEGVNRYVIWDTIPGIEVKTDTGVVAVDSLTGAVTALRAGVQQVEVHTIENGLKDTVTIAVYTPVTSVEITGAKLKNDTVTLSGTDTAHLSVNVLPKEAKDKSVEWSSQYVTVATVTDGVVEIVGPGITKVYAVSNDNKEKKDSVYVAVKDIPVTGVTIAAHRDSLPLTEGRNTAQLIATPVPANADVDYSITWSLQEEADTLYAEVSETGLVTALADGKPRIVATLTSGEETYRDTTSIVTYTIPVTKVNITLSNEDKAIERGGSKPSVTLHAEVEPDSATYPTVVYLTDDTAVVAVDSLTGLVTAVWEGKATITAAAQKYRDINYSVQIDVTVAEVLRVKEVTLNEDTVVLHKGATLTLTATPTPATAVRQAVSWTASPADAVTLTPDTLDSRIVTITALAAAEEVTITATAQDDYKQAKATALITITVPVDSVAIIAATDSLVKGDTLQLVADILPEDVDVPYETAWTSSADSVAAVDSITGLVTAISDGEAIITLTVTTEDGIYTDDATLTVYTVTPKITGVTIESASDLLLIDSTLQLSANVATVGDPAPEYSVVWSITTGEGHATIDANGRVTGVSAGDAIVHVIVTTEDGATVTASKTIKVVEEIPQPVIPEITEVSIAGGKETLAIDSTLQLSAVVTIEPADSVIEYTLAWSSSDEEVATVDETGLVTAVAEGEATIYLSVITADSAYTAELTLTVTEEPVTPVEPVVPEITEVAIAGATDSLAVEATLQLEAVVTVEPADSTVDYIVGWASSDEAVATVDEEGLVTGIADGEAVITLTVTTADSVYKADVTIEVYTEVKPEVVIPVEGVTIKDAPDSLAVGETITLAATLEPDSANVDYEVLWLSSPAVALTNDGLTAMVTGVSEGEATIQVQVTTEDGAYSTTIRLKVYTEPEDTTPVVPEPVIPEITEVAIQGAVDGDSLEVEATLQLSADVTIEPADSTIAYETAWATSDEEVATVSEDGLVTAVSEGSATITLTVTTADSSYTAEVTLKVYTEEVVPQPIPVTGVTLDKETATLAIDETLQLTATITPEDADNKNVTWSSSNEAVATVDNTGLVTAIATGEATITVTTEDGEHKASVIITVEEGDGVEVPVTSVKAYIADNTLYVNSAVTEKVDIYTISGKLVYSAVKPAGEVQITLTTLSDGVLIIRGASGWVQKIVK